MTHYELKEMYFDWMCRLLDDGGRYSSMVYSRLLRYLHSVSFQYSIPMDENREVDGFELRYRFARENNLSEVEVASCLDTRPCSMLEMMVALAIRMEEHIMEDLDIGDRTGEWFWEMIVSLGLDSMTNTRFEWDRVIEATNRFLNREYTRDGEGGLFTVHNSRQDMRSLDIWYQMCAYIESIT